MLFELELPKREMVIVASGLGDLVLRDRERVAAWLSVKPLSLIVRVSPAETDTVCCESEIVIE
jgi:hypothetical protein